MRNHYFSAKTDFYGHTSPKQLIEEFGSPLYVYNEAIFRQCCYDMSHLLDYENFQSTYSIKANSNLELLKIARSEGMQADAMSPGEIHVLLAAGYTPNEIFYISNNVDAAELQFAIDAGVKISVDSLSQLALYCSINPNSKIAIRLNPGVGVGHHQKVVTGGKKTKFGINLDLIDEAKAIAQKYNVHIAGINQHLGSLFMDGADYVKGVKSLLDVATSFDDLDFVDMGGGFGIPYHKQEGQAKLDVKSLGAELTDVVEQWTDVYGKKIQIKTEPGRYICAESGILLGTVNSVKRNYDKKYVGTDLGFNVLVRPTMYDSHHDVEVYNDTTEIETVNLVGNICESGDYIAQNRELPVVTENDLIGVVDAGAYGYTMSSNYNNRLRPAEVLITKEGTAKLIRRRDTLDDLLRNFL